MRIQSLKTIHWVAVAIGVLAVGYAVFHFSEAEALSTKTVGSLSIIAFNPRAVTSDEFFTMDFSGVANQNSVADFSGWYVENDANFKYALDDVLLSNKGSVMICEQGANDPNCDYFWQGNDVFPDDTGEFRIIAHDGSVAVRIPYTTTRDDQTFTGDGSYIADVYKAGDKVTICSNEQNGTIKQRSENIMKILGDSEKGTINPDDTIPGFVYDVKKSLSYHPGTNWPDNKEFLNRGCK